MTAAPAPTSTTPAPTLNGARSSTFGYAVAGAGDVDGNGTWDVAIGATNLDAIMVYEGAAGGLSTTPLVTLTGPTHSYFGAAVALRRSRAIRSALAL